MASTVLLALVISIGDYWWGAAQTALAQENGDTPKNSRSIGSSLKSARRAAAAQTATNAARETSPQTTIITSVARRAPVRAEVSDIGIIPAPQKSNAASEQPSAKGSLRRGARAEIYNDNGTLRYWEGALGVVRGDIRQNRELSNPYTLVARRENALADETARREVAEETFTQETLALLSKSGVLRGMARPSEELTPLSAVKDRLGYRHLRFEQSYKGLRVHGRDIYAHFTPDGVAYSVHGLYEPTPENDIPVAPAITQESAFIAARNALENEGLWKKIAPSVLRLFGAEQAWTGELLWYPVAAPTNPRLADKKAGKSSLRLAYAITTATSVKRAWTYFIDARTGETLGSLRLHKDDQDYLDRYQRTPRNSSLQAEKTPQRSSADDDTAYSIASGADESGAAPAPSGRKGETTLQNVGFISVAATTTFGEEVEIRSWKRPSDGRIFPVSDYLARETSADRLPARINGGSVILDAGNTEVEDASEARVLFINDGQRWRRDIAAAMSYTDSCRRYFAVRHGRASWDGNGSRIQTLLNVGAPGSRAAWWNPGLMAQGYGDGGGIDKPEHQTRDLFLFGHEVGHAYNTIARLEYNQSETGALEEHFANLWGWMLDRTTNYYSPRLAGYGDTPGEGLHWGEQDSTGEGWRAIRNVRDFYVVGTPRAEGLQFPHANAPICDRASWLFFKKFGRDTTEQIWWRTLAHYMTQSSGFNDLRLGTLRAAEDLYPGNSAVAAALRAAFDDVGITGAPTSIVASRKRSEGSEVELAAVASVIAFTTQSGRIGLYNPASNAASLFSGADAVARTRGARSQLSAARSGRSLFFANQNGQLASLDLTTNRVTTYTGVQIRRAGDIGNVAVSPDGAFVVMTSEYENDPNVYLVTMATVSASGVTRPRIIPLQRLVGPSRRPLAEGRQVSGIRFPDALAWSPDSRAPEIAFDAYHELTVEGDTIPFWALYYASMGSQPTIYELYPPQPDYNLSFPAYSSLNPNTIVFSEYIPENDDKFVHDFYVANFDRPEDIGYLNLRNFSLNNRPLLDADQPVFSPDDRELCFTSAAQPRSLLFYTFGQTGQPARVRAVTLDSTVSRPYWANLDVAVGVREAETHSGAVFGLGAYPNPARNETSVRFVVPLKAERVRLQLFDALGREALTAIDGVLPQGDHSVSISLESLPPGAYIVRLQIGASGVETQKILINR